MLRSGARLRKGVGALELPATAEPAPTRARAPRLISAGVALLVAASLFVQLTVVSSMTIWIQELASLLLASTAFTLVGGAIASRRPANAFGWLLLAIGATSAVGAAGFTIPGPWLALWIGYWAWLVPLGLLPIALLLFPTGRLPSRRWRAVLAISVIGTVEPAAALAVASYIHPDPLGLYIDAPTTGAAYSWVLAARFGVIVAGLGLVLSLASLVARFQSAQDVERRQVLCLCVGGLALLLGLILDVLGLPVGWAVVAVALPVAAGVAILWHRLYDLDLLINRSLVYAGLSVTLLAAYGTIVWVGNQMVHTVLPTEALPLIAAAVVAVALEPLRAALQHSVDHLLYGDRSDPYAVVTAVGRQAETSTGAREVLSDVAETVAKSLALPYVAIDLATDDGQEPAAEWGRRLADPIPLPLSYRGERVGTLLASPRTVGRPFSGEERRLLDDLACQVALTAHVVRLSTGLQRSREALVAAREEERRRLRRDLHDGLGPSLAGMTMKLEAARNSVTRAPEVADRLLEELRDDAMGAVGDIRRAVYALRPPTLDELGLTGAIKDYTDRFRLPADDSGGLAVSLELPDTAPQLPAAVEVAALRIVQEALANVAHHSNAHACRVRLSVDEAVNIDVEDDGQGLPSDFRGGVGLRSMRERAAEVGGRCEIEPRDPKGTRVSALLPLTAA